MPVNVLFRLWLIFYVLIVRSLNHVEKSMFPGVPFRQVYSHLAINILSVITGNGILESARVEKSSKNKGWSLRQNIA